ncbi:MAG TPA: hypothetical protein VFR58_17010 [Flavisolibacter sp.]|nr:hypothetical protein [Flavisolibacter sp.]
MNSKKPRFLFLLSFLLLLFACKKDLGNPSSNPAVDLASARMNDFQLVETGYLSIQVVHPTISGGAETSPGKITVLVPQGSHGLQLTPKLSNFTSDRFTVYPALGVIRNFSAGPLVYEIASNTDPDKKVHYEITITEEQGTGSTGPEVTGFRFEKSRNPQLAADVSAAEIVHSIGGMGKIYVFVPLGTDFTSLRPTVSFNGAGLYWSQDATSAPAASTAVYPSAGLDIDFAYPKVFYLAVKNGTENKIYDVMVDVRNPVRLDDASIIAPNTIFGNTGFYPALTRYINQGNHAVSFDATTYANQVPAGSSAIRAMPSIPNLGLMPGEMAGVNITVNGLSSPPGNYQSTAVLRPKLYGDNNAPSFDAVSLDIRATISN